MVRPRNNPKTGEFLGLFETIGYLVVRGSPEEVIFNYGFDKEKSKILYSTYERRTPSSFSGTAFNRHESMIESGEVQGDFSNIYFFLPAITNRSEDINHYLNNVSISPIDITQSQLNDRAGTKFDPSKLDMFGLQKVVKCLKHMNDVPNSNILRNADGLLSRTEVEVPVDWIGENKKRVPSQKFKVSY